jgi:hypothetical protein
MSVDDSGQDTDDHRGKLDLAALRAAGEAHPLFGVFARFIEYREDTVALVEMAIAGAQVLNRLGEVDVDLGLTREKGAEAPYYSVRARRDIDEDFPLLRGHALVGLWGAFEAFHEDLAVEWVRARPSALGRAVVMSLSVPLGEYEALDEVDRAVYLVRLLKRESNLDRQPGLGQFLPMLKQVGIFGSVDDDVRREVVEFQQARHVWAHRGGLIDERFAELCPWRTDLTVGSRLHLTHEDFFRLTGAASTYVGGVFEWVYEGLVEVYEAGKADRPE